MDPKKTSKECPRCHAKLRGGSGHNIVTCMNCGLTMDRHSIVAWNIMNRGIREMQVEQAKRQRSIRNLLDRSAL